MKSCAGSMGKRVAKCFQRPMPLLSKVGRLPGFGGDVEVARQRHRAVGYADRHQEGGPADVHRSCHLRIGKRPVKAAGQAAERG